MSRRRRERRHKVTWVNKLPSKENKMGKLAISIRSIHFLENKGYFEEKKY